ATRALERSAQILSERGETWAARAAWSRLLASGAGADDARARWRRAAASEEPTSRPVSAPGRLKRRWTTLLPERPTRARPPVDRQAIDLGDAIAVQAPGELLLLDGATGRIRDRAPLPAGAKVDAAPLRRLARLSGDGSWIALAYAGTLALYERAPDGLRMRWTKSAPDSGWYADGPVVSGGRVVAAACAAQVETTVHVEAFDPATGERLFRRLLAKGGEPSPPDAPARALHPALVSPAPVVAAGPLAIVSTELGIVAGVDPLDGEIAWAVRTRRADAARTSIPVAPIALADRVVVAPADSDHVYVFRAAPASLRDPQTLFASPPIRLGERTFAGCFGADERRAYLVTQASGPSTSIEAVRLDDGSREVEDVPPEERGLGVPALLGGGIYLATDHGLVSFDARGELRAFAVAADGDGEFGDLSPVEDGVVSVSTASVSRHDVVP
ncbi:MAG TPA: PQQ-binding-like beta-propeller repeat protein, partial [Planctomycetota bacterium]|nr:PQQ-binding-like beta-propeller repeat protein [Planctomycetota bacterium]